MEDTKRIINKMKLEEQCYKLMKDEEKYCNDNTHLLACIMIKNEFGISITPKIVSRLRSIDRSRQKVLKQFPHLDQRKRSLELEEKDKQYYAEHRPIGHK